MRFRFATEPLRRLLGAVWPRLHHVGSIAMWVAGINALKEHGFHPKTVFDIGVAAGTPDLYAAFPGSHYFLVDPTPESVERMKAIAKRLDADVCAFALGDRDGEMEIETRPDDINGATFFKEIGPLRETNRIRVPVRRFDSAFNEFARPALCKIDVQGAELMVLRGMGERLDEIEVFIVEISTLATVADAPEAGAIIAFFRERGYVMFDILGTARRPLDDMLSQLDVMFVKQDSPLRADRRWRADT